MQFDKQFNFIELARWEFSGCFKPIKNKEPYCIMMPPPNVTGKLHMGHALTFTIQDILIRYYRMKNKEVLWQPGIDHAGIATQMVVESQLLEQNIDRRDLGREKFIEKVWAWKNESSGNINQQLKKLGASADWSRDRFTMDEGLSKAVRKVFVDLYNAKIIYKDKRLVNWDPKLLTAISDLEVEQREQEGTLWYIKYPINDKDFIVVATTRPETMFGDTAVAVHPDDERYKKFIGLECNLPLTDRKIKIIADEYVDPEKGSGVVKITPAHDFNDFEIGKRHNLTFINIFDEHAKLSSFVPKIFQGLDRYTARNKILNSLSKLNLLVKEERQLMVIPYGDRSGTVIEPWLTDQWFCDAKKLSIDPIEAVKTGETKFIPKQWEKTFFNWMENIQPWCISRQLWWGHQIPAWYGPDGHVFVSMNFKDAQKQAKNYYKKDVDLKQDEDVLDTWFSSALWTFSTLDWPNDSYELKRFYPGNVLVTGFDIIFFWVARMMMMGSYFMKKTPFRDVYIHPLIRDEKGQKMSKSKGNIIDPLDLLNKYGADTLRFTLTALLNPGRDVKLSESRVKGYKSFTNKIWNAANFLIINDCQYDINFNFDAVTLPLNQWLINKLCLTINNIEKYMKNYAFHEVANEMYHFIWHEYCDWYIELSKPSFQNNTRESEEVKKVAILLFIEILKMIHPVMPFISEKLWNILTKNQDFLMNQSFSSLKELDSYKNSQKNIDHLIEIISSIRNLRSELNISYKKKLEIEISNSDDQIIKFLKEYEKELSRLLKLDKIVFNSVSSSISKAAYLVVSQTTIIIPLKEIIDTKSELQKIENKKNKIVNELENIELKLLNTTFIDKAPQEIIDQFKEQATNLKSSIEKMDQIINNIR